jgi:hypothetical protein
MILSSALSFNRFSKYYFTSFFRAKERAPHKDTTVIFKQKQISGHENQKGLDIKTF